MHDLRHQVGSQIRSLRRDRKMTQATLAKQAELSRDMVGLIERGRAAPSLSALERLGDALGVPPAVLLDIAESDRDPNVSGPRARIMDMVSDLDFDKQKIVGEVIETILRW